MVYNLVSIYIDSSQLGIHLKQTVFIRLQTNFLNILVLFTKCIFRTLGCQSITIKFTITFVGHVEPEFYYGQLTLLKFVEISQLLQTSIIIKYHSLQINYVRCTMRKQLRIQSILNSLYFFYWNKYRDLLSITRRFPYVVGKDAVKYLHGKNFTFELVFIMVTRWSISCDYALTY